jgi:hypothetical protein
VRFGEQGLAPPGLLVQAARGRAQFDRAAGDDDGIVEPGGSGVADGQVDDGVGALARFLRGALVDPDQTQQVGPRAFEPLELVRVIDDAGQVGVLVIDAHGKEVCGSNQAAARRGELAVHVQPSLSVR